MAELNPISRNGLGTNLGHWRVVMSGGADGMGNHLHTLNSDEQELVAVISDGINTWDVDLSVVRNRLTIEVSKHDLYGADPHTGWSIPLPVGEVEEDLHSIYADTINDHEERSYG